MVFKNIFKKEIKGESALLIDTFGSTTTKGKTFSTGIGVDHKDSSRALEAL
ncbi:MAG: hypothetical protein IPJ13_01465 [Saprospiraceae bacterium]|nr:hypothetical protein [Saprospiraceae bacterium]